MSCRFTIIFSLFALLVGGGSPEATAGHPLYQFASRLLNQVADEIGSDQNLLISPFSIRTALAILSLGARGQTVSELQSVLNLPSAQDDLVLNLGRQISTTSSSESSTFKIGNGLFLDNSFALNDTLASILQTELGANVEQLDFKNDPSASASSVNKWISGVTKGHIKNLFGASSTPSLSFLLANALFYSGTWERPFSILTKKSSFLLDSGDKVGVTMMALESGFGYSYIPELKSTAISIPFKDDRFDFIIIKPGEGEGVASVRPLLEPPYPLDKLVGRLEDSVRTVLLRIPKFTLKANYDMINVMKKMGILSLFDPRKGDLSPLAKNARKGKRSSPIVSKMVHQTLLDVNELGATAAAGTALAGYPISAASSLDVDKPFLFLLNDRITGPVLIGQLANPTE